MGSIPKGSTKNQIFTGTILRYARVIQHTYKLSWTAALAKAKAIAAL